MKYFGSLLIQSKWVSILIFILSISLSNSCRAISMKVDRILLNQSANNVAWTQVNFQQNFSSIPVVFVLPTNSNSEPATVRIRNVSTSGFEISVFEPQGEDGNTDAMSVDFFAAEIGSYSFPGGINLIVGTHATDTYAGNNVTGSSSNGDLILFPGGSFNARPAIIAEIQTVNSQPALMPTQLASPWLETWVSNVNNGNFRLGLDRAQTSTGTVVTETIGYLAMTSAGEIDLNGTIIKALRTADNIRGWDDGCFFNNYPSPFVNTPLVVASPNTRDGSDGLWVRRCGISNTSVGLTMDEDQDLDTERNHTTEIAGILAIEEAFNTTLNGGQFEAGNALISSSNAQLDWTHIDFPNPFSATPMVFTLPTTIGDLPPATTRIRNVTINGFDASVVEPPGSPGSHSEMSVDYVAIIPGRHKMTNGDIFEAGSVSTSRFQSKLISGSSWETISFIENYTSEPAVILEIQGTENNLGLHPSLPAQPWLETSASGLTSNQILVALERSETTTGSLNLNETIAYFSVRNTANGNLVATNSDLIDYEMFRTPTNIVGFDNSCTVNNFSETYPTSSPLSIASQNSRFGGDGGWLRRCSLQNNAIGLISDEDQANDSDRSHTTENASVFVFSQAFEADFPVASEITIEHDTSGINCLREAIKFTVVDNFGAAVTDYVGTINLTTSSNNGTWFLLDDSGNSSDLAQGTLSDLVNDDGAASYTFVSADLGSIVLYLNNTHEENIDIDAQQGTINDDDGEGNIQFRPSGFVISPSTIVNQIAGRTFEITLTAAGQTPTQTECGVIEEYTGNKEINFWSSYHLPNNGTRSVTINSNTIATSEVASTPQTTNFNMGSTTLNVLYEDVGQISFSAKDQVGIGDPVSGLGTEIIGGVAPFIISPFAYELQVSGNPEALDASGSVFKKAGEDFDITIRSLLWQSADDINNDGVVDAGATLSDNGITPNISLISGSISLSQTAHTGANSQGALADTSVNFNEFGAPATATEGLVTISQNWDEVGIIQINAATASFMGTTRDIAGERNHVGRFIPDHFEMTLTPITMQCGSFTFGGFFDGVNSGLDKNGQPFDIDGDISAKNAAGITTQNYVGDFAKLTTSDISLSAYNGTDSIDASGRLNLKMPLNSLSFITGNSAYSFPESHYQFDSMDAQFDLRVDLEPQDSDSVVITTPISGKISSNLVEVRLGRLLLRDTYGPEIKSLEMPLKTEYFDGTEWLVNTQDNCTDYDVARVSFEPGSYTESLNSGETTAFFPLATLPETLTNGESSSASGLLFSAPGDGNFGSVIVNFSLLTQPWLGFDWRNNDNIIDPPAAVLNFGYYRGSDRVIFWREVRN